MVSRRDFFSSMVGAAAVTVPTFRKGGIEQVLSATSAVAHRSPEEVAQDEDYWMPIQQAFTVDRSIINLNNGGVSPAPKVVQDALRRYVEYSNEAPVYTMWDILEPKIESVRRRLADDFGCDTEEMAITRNASEALEICEFGIDLQPGDEVLTTDQDYGRMLTTYEQRVRREGIVLKKVSFPNPPPSQQYLVDMFEQAITPRTKILHFCHLTNLTGLIFPVKKICQMARARGIETIVDGAHAYAHFPFKQADLDCDRYGTSLHKWLLAPHGTGFLYVRRDKIKSTWPLMAANERQDEDIRKYEEIGTHPAGNHNAIAEALTFHRGIGAERKAARLRYLRDRFMRHFDAVDGVTVNTSFDPEQSCGIGNIRVDGMDQGKIRNHLWKTKRILSVAIGHPDCTGLRVTPNVYTTLDEIDTFIESLEDVVRNGVPE